MQRTLSSLLLVPLLTASVLAVLSVVPAQAQYHYGQNPNRYGQAPANNGSYGNGSSTPNPNPYMNGGSRSEPYKIGTNGNFGKYGNYGYLYGGKKKK